MTSLIRIAAALAFAASATPASARVVAADERGFILSHEVRVPVPAAEAFAALGRIGDWWDPSHTYSGSAAQLRLDLTAPGCFCETVPADGSSIEHGRVVYVRPGHTLRIQAMLGPLQSEAGAGVVEWTLTPAEGGGTNIRQTYRVAGFTPQGFSRLAPLVDQVMTQQLDRLQAHLSRGR